MTKMRNTSKNAVRTGYSVPKPKYAGKALWGMRDHLMKCRDCNRYASHEAVVKHEPNPFNSATTAKVALCVTHSNRAVTENEVISIKPYDEYVAHLREVNRWQKSQVQPQEGML